MAQMEGNLFALTSLFDIAGDFIRICTRVSLRHNLSHITPRLSILTLKCMHVCFDYHYYTVYPGWISKLPQ